MNPYQVRIDHGLLAAALAVAVYLTVLRRYAAGYAKGYVDGAARRSRLRSVPSFGMRA